MSDVLLDVRGLKVHYPVRRTLFGLASRFVYAVDGIDFSIARGETLGVVGESGCGKSTVAKAVMRLVRPTAGAITLDDVRLDGLSRRRMGPHRRKIQIVFQDPYASLDPRMSAGASVAEPLVNFRHGGRREIEERVAWLFEKVGLRPDQMRRPPHEFSGGQRQRLGIARALALQPKLIVADEPVSALDVSVQAQVINLLMDLQTEFGLSYLFVAHDLAVVEHISHRIAVMYLGKIVEIATRDTLFSAPLHPYTEALLSAAPIPDPRAPKCRRTLGGDVPSPLAPPSGCRFHTRCPLVQERCRVEEPDLRARSPTQLVACHFR